MAVFAKVVLLSCFGLMMGVANKKSNSLETVELESLLDQNGVSMVRGLSTSKNKDVSSSNGTSEGDSVEEAVNFLVTGLPDSTELKVIDDTLERAKTHVMDKLVEQFEEEQLSLKGKIEHLQNTTAHAVLALAAAQAKDVGVDTCMTDVNALRKVLDDCDANVSTARGSNQSSCHIAQGYSPGVFDIAAEDETEHYTPTVQCNFSTFTIVGRSEKCDNFVQFVGDVAENKWDSLESVWSEKSDNCTSWSDYVNVTSNECQVKLDNYKKAKATCESLKAQRALARCQFENALARKCKALKQFDEHVTKIQESQRDAQARYDRMRMAYCLLDKYRHTNEQYCLDEDAKDTCTNDPAYFYNETIGTMDHYEAKKADSSLELSCAENTEFILGKDADKNGAMFNTYTGYYNAFTEDFASKKVSGSMTVQERSGVIAGALCEQPAAITGNYYYIDI